MLIGSRLVSLLAGIALLTAGRRLYWLMVGVVGFLVGFLVIGEALQGPLWLELVGGLTAGLVASVLVVFFQRIVLAVAGFLVGILVVLWWAEKMQWGERWWVWAAAVVAGILAAALVRGVFEAGLIVLSSVLGATFVLEALARPADGLSPVYVTLVAAGVLIQFFGWRRRRRQ